MRRIAVVAAVAHNVACSSRGHAFMQRNDIRPALEVTSVNIGRAETVEHLGREYRSGIRKRPVNAAVDGAGVGDDVVCNRKHHGGPDQAAYLYRLEDYAWWERTYGRPFAPGAFGENLTIAGMPADSAVGDRLLIGTAVLELTGPRVPCAVLSAHMQNPDFALAFRQARRPGAYCGVLNPGELRSGDRVEWVATTGARAGIVELFDYLNGSPYTPADLERFLAAPLAARLRRKIEARRRGSAV